MTRPKPQKWVNVSCRERAAHCLFHGSGGLVKSNVDVGALLRKIVLSFEEGIAKYGRIKLLG